MAEVYELPEGWGADSLSYFQNITFANEQWSFVNDALFNRLLSDCDSLIFDTLLEAAPKHKADADIAALLFINAHNHLRASIRLCLSGQLLPVYPTARACLETAVYGWYLKTDVKLIELWHNKPKATDRKAYREWNEVFKYSKITKLIGQHNSRFEKMLKQSYQTAIDFGGHPNTESLYANLIAFPDEQRLLHTITYIHSEGVLFSYTSAFILDIAMSLLTLIKFAYHGVADDDANAEYNALIRRVNDFQRNADVEIERLSKSEA